MRGASQRFWRDPRMPHVESRRASHSRACYKPHSHPTFSIGAVDAGSSVFSGAGGSLILDWAGPAEALRIANQIRRAQGHAPAFELHFVSPATG